MGLQILPMLISAGQDVAGLIANLRAALNQKTDPTPEQWASLDNQMSVALAALDKASK